MALARSGVTIFFATLPGIAENKRGADGRFGARGSIFTGLSVSVLAGTETFGWLGNAPDEKGPEGDVVQRATATPGNKTSLNEARPLLPSNAPFPSY